MKIQISKIKYQKLLLAVFCLPLVGIVSGCSNGNDKITAKSIQDKKADRIVKMTVDVNEEEKLQKAADKGYQSWRNNPVDVAQAALLNAGANVNMADCRLLSEKAAEAIVAASDKKGSYKVICV